MSYLNLTAQTFNQRSFSNMSADIEFLKSTIINDQGPSGAYQGNILKSVKMGSFKKEKAKLPSLTMVKFNQVRVDQLSKSKGVSPVLPARATKPLF